MGSVSSYADDAELYVIVDTLKVKEDSASFYVMIGANLIFIDGSEVHFMLWSFD